MNLAVIGSRTVIDEELVFKILDNFKGNIKVLISGGAKGADKHAEKWAALNNIPTIIHLPDWVNHGKSAGIRRNRLIAQDCDQCVAFWDGESKGTKSTIDLCLKLQKQAFDAC